MDRSSRKSGAMLALAGVLGAVFFYFTDPRFRIVTGAAGVNLASNPLTRDQYYQVIDAANQAVIGTTVGICGSVVFLLIGIYLMTRRMAS